MRFGAFSFWQGSGFDMDARSVALLQYTYNWNFDVIIDNFLTTMKTTKIWNARKYETHHTNISWLITCFHGILLISLWVIFFVVQSIDSKWGVTKKSNICIDEGGTSWPLVCRRWELIRMWTSGFEPGTIASVSQTNQCWVWKQNFRT